MYPVDQAQPLKNITETHTEVTTLNVTTVTDTVEDTTVSLPMSVSTTTRTGTTEVKTTLVIVLSIACTIFAFGAFYSLFKCQQEGEDGANVRNATNKQGLI